MERFSTTALLAKLGFSCMLRGTWRNRAARPDNIWRRSRTAVSPSSPTLPGEVSHDAPCAKATFRVHVALGTCCRRRCARVCGCPLSRVRRRLRLSAFAGAAASAVVRFRGCGGVCGCHRTSKSSNGLAGVDDRIFLKNKLRAGCYEHLDDHLALANQASLAMKTRRGRLVAC